MPDGRTILIIAPDETARRSLRFLLEAEGFVVLDCQPGSGWDKALDAADCIVVDGGGGGLPNGEIAASGRPVVMLVDKLGEEPPAGRWLVQKPMLGEALIASVRAALLGELQQPAAAT